MIRPISYASSNGRVTGARRGGLGAGAALLVLLRSRLAAPPARRLQRRRLHRERRRRRGRGRLLRPLWPLPLAGGRLWSRGRLRRRQRLLRAPEEACGTIDALEPEPHATAVGLLDLLRLCRPLAPGATCPRLWRRATGPLLLARALLRLRRADGSLDAGDGGGADRLLERLLTPVSSRHPRRLSFSAALLGRLAQALG